MVKTLIAFVAIAIFAGGAAARGGGHGGGYYIYVPGGAAGQPGDACIPEGVTDEQETKKADGTSVLVLRVHGADSARCPDSAFPELATTQKIAPDEVRNVASTQCVKQGLHVGDEVTIPFFGRVTVLDIHATNMCSGSPNSPVEATVIGTAAYRATKSAKAIEPADSAAPPPASAPDSPRTVTEADLQKEYDRLFAAAAPVEEYHVRHILLRTREEAVSAIERIRKGESFAEVAAKLSIDPGSRMKGGDLGWNVQKSFIEEFSKTMVGLKPAGLAPEPTRTKFGWHVIEVLQTKTGKDSFPKFLEVKDRIAAKLLRERDIAPRVSVAAVCRKMVAAEMPAAAAREHLSGTIVAEMRVENGKVAEVTSLSGPSVFHEAVTAAIGRYECDQFNRPVTATQTFTFKAE